MPKKTREPDTTLMPASWSMLCGAEFLRCPKWHAEAPHQCASCGFFHSAEWCHQCECQVCPLLRAESRAFIASFEPVQRGLFDHIYLPVPLDNT